MENGLCCFFIYLEMKTRKKTEAEFAEEEERQVKCRDGVSILCAIVAVLSDPAQYQVSLAASQCFQNPH